MTAAVALALRLKTGGWQCFMHADGSGAAMWFYRSALDPRVQMTKVMKRGSADMTTTWSFGDPGVDVSIVPGGPIVEEANARTFGSLDELAACILTHDEALARDRAWEAAAPPS